MTKDTDEQPDKEFHGMMSGRVLSSRASIPVGLGCTALLASGMFTSIKSCLRVFKKLILQPPIPSLKLGDGDKSSNPINHLVFLFFSIYSFGYVGSLLCHAGSSLWWVVLSSCSAPV